jgi:myo-inositol-1(or 4)-monophosphatase
VSQDLTPYLALASKAARTAGEFLAGRSEETKGVEKEVGRDIKLAADRKAEALVLGVLNAGADLPVLAEESGASGLLSGLYWVVDPLDGSANYNRGLPLCAVSIALMRNDEPVLGVIYDIGTGEMMTGAEGQPATLEGVPIRVSGTREKSTAILATGLPVMADYSAEALQAMAADFAAWKKVRMLGTATLAGGYVACGRIDRYAESGARLWDVAAAIAIVKAAGGRAIISGGAPDAPRTILIDNGCLPD